MHAQTMEHVRELRKKNSNDLFNRKSRAAWEKDTEGKSISEIAAEKACFIMKNHVPVFLPDGATKKMDKILMDFKDQ